MKITVTKQDIENGRRCDPDCCPVGRALSRAGVLHLGVVGAAVMVADGPGHAVSLPLPGAVESWILDFDGSRPVEPMSFELALPAQRKNGPRHNGRTRRQPASFAAA